MNESQLPSLLVSGKCQLDELFTFDPKNESISDCYNFLFELFSIDPEEIPFDKNSSNFLSANIYGELSSTIDKVQIVLEFMYYINTQNVSLRKKKSVLHSTIHVLEISYITIFLIYSGFDQIDLTNFVVNSVLAFDQPPEALIKIVLTNFPYNLTSLIEEVFSFLLNNPEYQNKFQFFFELLCRENLSHFQLLCSLCIDKKSFPNLFFPILVKLEFKESEDWFLHTISTIFNFRDNNEWFSDYFQSIKNSAQHKNLYLSFIDRITKISQELLIEDEEESVHKEKIAKRLNFFNLILYLRSNFEIDYHPKLSENILRLIVEEKTLNEFNVDVIKFSICFFIYVRPMLINSQAKPLDDSYVFGVVENELHEFVKSIINQLNGMKASENLRAFSELILLINALSQNNSIAISENVTKILVHKLKSLGKLISAARKVIKENHFSEFILVSQQKNFPFTYDLNDSMEAYLPIHYVISVFQSNNLSRWKEFTPTWILMQIINSQCPIHNTLPELMEKYVETVMLAQNKLDPFSALLPLSKVKEYLITEDDILHGRPPQKDLSKVVLFTYYALLVFHNQIRLGISDRHPNEYFASHSDFDSVPLTFVINHCQKNLSNHHHIYPRLLELAITYFPHLLRGENLIQDEFLVQNARIDNLKNYLKKDEESYDHLASLIQKSSSACSQGDFLLINKSLDYFYNCLRTNQLDEIFQYAHLLCGDYLSLFLEEDSVFSRSWRFTYKFETIWKTLHLLMPKKIQLISINWLLNNARESSYAGGKNKFTLCKPWENYQNSITYDDLVDDPIENLLALVDKRIFRSPQIFLVVIRCMESLLIASKSQWTFRINQRNEQYFREGLANPDEDQSKKLKVALLIAQDVTVIQLLLEACLPTPNEANGLAHIGNLRKIQLDVCSFIHNVFIADPYLVDIVNWHMYPFSLVEMMCSGVPSMHVLLENFPELLRLSGNINKVIFYSRLIGCLAKYFNIRLTSDRASILISVIGFLTASTSKDEFHPAIQHLLPPLVELTECLPNLANEAVGLIRKFGCICASLDDLSGYNDCNMAVRKILQNSLFIKSIFF